MERQPCSRVYCIQLYDSIVFILKRHIYDGDTRYHSWLKLYTTSLKVAGSNSDEVMGFLIDVILPAPLWLGIDSASDRNEYQESSCGLKRSQRPRLMATCELPVSRLYRQCGILDLPRPYRPPRPVARIALLLMFYSYRIYDLAICTRKLNRRCLQRH
jgi:hypothetical protein